MREVYIHDIGSAVGGTTEYNDAATLGQSEADWQRLTDKIGIRSRSIAGPGQYTSDLARAATEALISRTSVHRDAIGTLVVCTQTPDHLIPGVASRLHGQLSLPQDCFVLDINQGCTGFVLGTQVMVNWLRASGGNGILVNADTYSKLIRRDDLTTRALFGDAAAATLYSTRPGGLRIVDSHSFADGTGYNAFIAHGSALRSDTGAPSGICMDGPGIFNFALRRVPESISAALDPHGLQLQQLRMVLFHQANSYMVGQLARKLKLTPEQVPQNCENLGNTVSASIPLLLMEQMPMLQPGDFVLAVGFGVGLSWGTVLLEYSEEGSLPPRGA
ncbi:MAG: ketoacyl-ACP synthase III [Dokdonella sp.]|uniref:ketoacyl-ACP synthase III n=1 Tax=Dokdonella sp. TaxID=2291710 RepID=UPI0025C2FFB9|nr:ketoacyl-ACP synthase III [Dokdonella sp.]MBZ0224258.1 ketoacyl-ACP synthase III [Dokdonella sp.]